MEMFLFCSFCDWPQSGQKLMCKAMEQQQVFTAVVTNGSFLLPRDPGSPFENGNGT